MVEELSQCYCQNAWTREKSSSEEAGHNVAARSHRMDWREQCHHIASPCHRKGSTSGLSPSSRWKPGAQLWSPSGAEQGRRDTSVLHVWKLHALAVAARVSFQWHSCVMKRPRQGPPARRGAPALPTAARVRATAS